MRNKELTGGVRTIGLEALIWTREFPNETEIVKCSRDVEKFKVEAKFLLTALLSREQVDAEGMVVKQIRGMLTQEIGCLFRKQGVGNDEGRG
jgi:hypothetical protein